MGQPEIAEPAEPVVPCEPGGTKVDSQAREEELGESVPGSNYSWRACEPGRWIVDHQRRRQLEEGGSPSGLLACGECGSRGLGSEEG